MRPLDADIAVSYPPPQGRFGDQLSYYLHAKWVSYRDGIPFLFKPFLFSDAFALHDAEIPWTQEKEESFDQVIRYDGIGELCQDSTLYIIPYFSECEEDRHFNPSWINIPVDWKDEGFKAFLKELFAPRDQYASFIPEGFEGITTALHVRRGGGYDTVVAYQLWPLRFPPDSYYIESLQKLCDLFPGTPIYAHVFTDDPDPSSLIRLYAEHLSGYPITFGCREEGNRHDAHQMDDFFGMMEFDCLIRSVSNFTLLHSVIGDYLVVITPKHCLWRRHTQPCNGLVLENYMDVVEVKLAD
ncbi:MAG: hypothetical protein V4492_09545, partial [Chlamydiota bacterium]